MNIYWFRFKNCNSANHQQTSHQCFCETPEHVHKVLVAYAPNVEEGVRVSVAKQERAEESTAGGEDEPVRRKLSIVTRQSHIWEMPLAACPVLPDCIDHIAIVVAPFQTKFVSGCHPAVDTKMSITLNSWMPNQTSSRHHKLEWILSGSASAGTIFSQKQAMQSNNFEKKDNSAMSRWHAKTDRLMPIR